MNMPYIAGCCHQSFKYDIPFAVFFTADMKRMSEKQKTEFNKSKEISNPSLIEMRSECELLDGNAAAGTASGEGSLTRRGIREFNPPSGK